MNPPPIPSEPQNKPSIARQLAVASLVAPLLAIGTGVIGSAGLQGTDNHSQSMLILGVVSVVLIVAGFVAGIIALAGIPTQGTKGILGRGITGLVINCLLILIMAANFLIGYGKKAAKSRAAFQHIQTSADDISSNLKNNFDPKKGITNVDFRKMDQLRSEMNSASTNLSGEDARIASAMAAYLDRIGSAMKSYQAIVLQMREAEVLKNFNSSDKEQFASRREMVQRFLQANSTVESVITNAEDSLRADLIKAHVSGAHLQSVMDGYHSSAAPLNVITLKIRECDDRMGNAILDALNTLEAEQGHWKIDPMTDRLTFTSNATRDAYNKSIIAMNNASAEQVKWQSKLIAVQQNQQKERAQPAQP